MSLLIKALQKAEKESSGQKQTESSELSLEPKVSNEDSPPALTQQEALNLAKEAGLTATAWDKKVASQETASFVFEAKAAATPKPSRGPLLAGLLLGVLCIVAGGLYYLEQQFNTPELVVPPRVTHIEGDQVLSQSTPDPVSESQTAVNAPSAESSVISPSQTVSSDAPTSVSSPEATVPEGQAVGVGNATSNSLADKKANAISPNADPVNNPATNSSTTVATKAKPSAESNEAQPSVEVVETNSVSTSKTTKAALALPKTTTKGHANVVEKPWTPLGVSRGKVVENTSSTITEAYQALVAGEDEKAHRLYRMVLKNDSRNVDAMLGLATIAQRQGKVQDAQAWYAKVLEVDPRNEFALSALNASAPAVDAVSYESKLKSMVAQQPKSATLHASLGSFYAEQGQWGQAQQSYFEAHHLDPMNAEYTYDLAVSLDQLGKGPLAAQFYREAISQLKPGQTLFDKEAVQARIQALAP